MTARPTEMKDNDASARQKGSSVRPPQMQSSAPMMIGGQLRASPLEIANLAYINPPVNPIYVCGNCCDPRFNACGNRCASISGGCKRCSDSCGNQLGCIGNMNCYEKCGDCGKCCECSSNCGDCGKCGDCYCKC